MKDKVELVKKPLKNIKWHNLLIKALILLGFGLLLTWFMEYRYFINDAGRVWLFLVERPLVFLYTAFLMWLILLIAAGFFRRPFLSVGVVTSLIIIVTYIHINKFIMRGTPLLPEDFQLSTEVGSLTKFVDWWGIVCMVLAIFVLIRLALFLDKITKPYLQVEASSPNQVWWKRWALLPRALLIVSACLVFVAATDFARHHGGQRYEEIPWLGSEFVAWNQVRNYDYNGFILGFLYNWSKFELQPPDGYSEAEITKIAKLYQKQKDDDEKHTHRTSLKDVDYNIVIILNESFFDPEILRDYYQYKGDVTPVLHKITENYPSGNMYSLDYGGGTANIEFETFTSLTNYWINTVPYTDVLPHLSSVPSIAQEAKAAGFATTAIHPFNGGMYKRNLALKVEGFDNFITELEMQHTEHDENSQYINDRAAYQEVLDVLNGSDNRQLVGLITMQNHTPYDADIYKKHDFEILNMNDEPDKKSDVETFFQTLHNSDQYLGEFIDSLEKSDEKTVVLFFGDHSPGIFSRVNDSEDKKVRDLARLTPYFIYYNFDLSNAEDDAILTTLPTTTPNCLVNTLYDTLSVKKPALLYLVNDICAKIPILTPAYFGDNAPFKSTELSSYELVTYDILGGEDYWAKALGEV